MGLSLWIVPDGREALKLERVMKVRPKNLKSSTSLSQASYPKFYPHITLASLPLSMENDLDIIDAAILKSPAPTRCNFTAVDIGSHYFRSVYVTINLTPDLVHLHEWVHNSLDIAPRTPAFPHMSLCYIDDVDAATGERVRFYEELKMEGKINHSDEVSGEVTSLNCGSFGERDMLNHFDAHEIWAVRCEGPVEGWEVLRKFSLVDPGFVLEK